MTFDLDRQTLNDLEIFQTGNNRESVFNLLCNAKTNGGQEALTEIFHKPLADAMEISDRLALFKFIDTNGGKINFNKNLYDFAEYYLKRQYYLKTSVFLKVIDGFFNSLQKNNEYYIVRQGIESLLKIYNDLLIYAEKLDGNLPKILACFKSVILTSFQPNEVQWLKQLIHNNKLSSADLSKADHFFRNTAKDKVRKLLDVAYQLEVYQTVNSRAKSLGFTLPSITGNESSYLNITGLFHPFIKDPIYNNISFDSEKNVCFITGANMAGKSSLLKSIGVSIYLSQLGFPVPAKKMETSLFSGLVTTINLSDDISLGHSHFYSEVLRVKQVAEKLKHKKNIFIIFDELFRGTNVKDAFDASLAIITAFSKIKNSFFVVSTHIVEIANELSALENIGFRYMETVFEGGNPVYSYQLKNGITEERVGMWIIQNEGILDIIEKALTTD